MTKSEFLSIINDITFEAWDHIFTLSDEEIETDWSMLPMPFCAISDNQLLNPFNFEGKDYPFGDFKERVKTTRTISEILKKRNITPHKYCHPDVFGLGSYPVKMLLQYPNYIYESFKISNFNQVHEIPICINNEILFSFIEEEGSLTRRFNKTVLELYENKKSKKYVECKNFILSRLEDWYIDDITLDQVNSLIHDNPDKHDKKTGETDENISERFSGEWKSTKIELVRDLRSDKDKGFYKTYAEAYRWAEEKITVNGEPVNAKRLDTLWHKTNSTNKSILNKKS